MSVVSFFFFSWPLCCCGLWLKALNPAGVALFFLVRKWLAVTEIVSAGVGLRNLWLIR